MTAGRGGALASVVVAALLVAGLGACGRKGPPVPPERRVPRQVTDLRGVVREGRIELDWSLPRDRMDGSRLIDPGQARVFRTEDAGTGDPKPALLVRDQIAGYTEVDTIRLADPPSPLVTGRRIVFPDRQGLTVGRRYTYVVVTTDSQGRTSAPSPRLTLSFLATPEPPTGLRAEAGERQVSLSWTPSDRLSDGSAVDAPLVYEVLRSTAADAPLAVVSRTEPGTTSMVDSGLQSDRTYHYAVRAIRQEGETAAEGETSTRIAVTPTDVTPPAPASNLVAVPSEGTVRLSWTPSPDADVAGYVVYRGGTGEPMVRVGSVRTPATTFMDREVPAGTYRYAVTAQDASTRANESRPTDEAVVTVP